MLPHHRTTNQSSRALVDVQAPVAGSGTLGPPHQDRQWEGTASGGHGFRRARLQKGTASEGHGFRRTRLQESTPSGGHGFSRAAQSTQSLGFSPCGLISKRAGGELRVRRRSLWAGKTPPAAAKTEPAYQVTRFARSDHRDRRMLLR